MKDLYTSAIVKDEDTFLCVFNLSTEIHKIHKIKEVRDIILYQPEASFSKAVRIRFVGKKKLRYKLLDLLKIKY